VASYRDDPLYPRMRAKARLGELAATPIEEHTDGEAVVLTTGTRQLPEGKTAQWTARVEPLYQDGSRVIVMTTRTLSRPDRDGQESTTARDYIEEARIIRPIDSIVARWIELNATP
jgi:hypothetical protein